MGVWGLTPKIFGGFQKLAIIFKVACISEHKCMCHFSGTRTKMNVRIKFQHKHLFTIANILYSLVALDIGFT